MMVGWLTIAGGIVLLVVGAVVCFGGGFRLLAWSRGRRVRDPQRLQRWAGVGGMCLGVLSLLAGVADLLHRRVLGGVLWVAFVLGVLVIGTRLRGRGPAGRDPDAGGARLDSGRRSSGAQHG